MRRCQRCGWEHMEEDWPILDAAVAVIRLADVADSCGLQGVSPSHRPLVALGPGYGLRVPAVHKAAGRAHRSCSGQSNATLSLRDFCTHTKAPRQACNSVLRSPPGHLRHCNTQGTQSCLHLEQGPGGLMTMCAQGKFGSTVPVSLLGCQLACEAATACTSIAYNAVLEECFLKSGQTLAVCTVCPLQPS